MDTVADLLLGVHLTGGVFLDAEFTAPWCVASKIGPEDCRPFGPVPRNIIAYHYVSAGRLLLQLDDQPLLTAKSGEIVVLPRNDQHRISSALNIQPVGADGLIEPAADGGLARIVYGGGGERTRILCGFLGNNTPNDPLFLILPQVLKLNVAEGALGGWIESSFKLAAQEMAAGLVESPAVLAKLAELLFMEAVRRYLASLPPDQNTWSAGIRDPKIGRALGSLHRGLNQRWTAEALAREVGMSRSAFAERFTRLIGAPPMRYLAQLRLQTAAQQLQNSRDGIARIAFRVGYDSEAAFNRAFKREFGVPPATWRKEQTEPSTCP